MHLNPQKVQGTILGLTFSLMLTHSRQVGLSTRRTLTNSPQRVSTNTPGFCFPQQKLHTTYACISAEESSFSSSLSSASVCGGVVAIAGCGEVSTGMLSERSCIWVDGYSSIR